MTNLYYYSYSIQEYVFKIFFFFFKENIGTYSVSLEPENCTEQPDNTRVTAMYHVPDHEMTIQLNLAGI